MNRSVLSDDDLVELLERTMQRVAAVAPDLPIEAPRRRRWPVTAAAATVAVVSVGGAVLLVDRPAGEPAATPPAASMPPAPTVDTTPPPSGTAPVDGSSDGSPRWATGTDPAEFPQGVPLPADVESVTPMEWDGLRVGWQFSGRPDPSTGTERCARYADAFDDAWTSTVDTDEHPSVVYAHHFGDDDWDVGIYCTDSGDFLVQFLSLHATTDVPPTTVDG